MQGRLIEMRDPDLPNRCEWMHLEDGPLDGEGQRLVPYRSSTAVDCKTRKLELWTADPAPLDAITQRPSHRAYTLTDRTLQLARDTARAVSGAGDRGDARERADELMRALEHAQGMPEADLRRLATWVRERCSDLELVQIADATLAHLALDAMPVGSVQVRDDLPSGWQWAKEKIASAWSAEGHCIASGDSIRAYGKVPREVFDAVERKSGLTEQDRLVSTLNDHRQSVRDPHLKPIDQAIQLIEDYAHAARSHDYAEGMKALRQRAETYERERDLARARVADLDARVVGLEHALDKATEVAQNWKSRLDSWEKINAERTENTRPAAYVDCLVLALLRIEAILSGGDPGSVVAPATAMPLHRAQSIVERATETRAEALALRNAIRDWRMDSSMLSLALRRIEAISNGQPPSSISDSGELMPVDAAYALASRLLSQFVEFGKVSDALAKAGARIAQLELDAEGAAKDRALVSATETLVRRMVDRLVETDPEWIDSLRKGGS